MDVRLGPGEPPLPRCPAKVLAEAPPAWRDGAEFAARAAGARECGDLGGWLKAEYGCDELSVQGVEAMWAWIHAEHEAREALAKRPPRSE